MDMQEAIEPGYEIDDPRPIAAEAPYTYFLPCEKELLAVSPGDLVKLNIRSIPPSEQYDAERMWVTVTVADAEDMTGTLDNRPYDMPHLDVGAKIVFRRSDIIDILWDEARETDPPARPPRRQYWERCLVEPSNISTASNPTWLRKATSIPIVAGGFAGIRTWLPKRKSKTAP